MNWKVCKCWPADISWHHPFLSYSMVSPLLVKRKVELLKRQKDRKLDDWNEAHEPEGCRFSSFNGQCFHIFHYTASEANL